MKTLSLLLILLLTMIPMQGGQWNVALQEPASSSLIAEPEPDPDPIDKEVNQVKTLARLTLGAIIVAAISLLIVMGAAAGPAEILISVMLLGLLASLMFSFINVLLARKVLKKLRALPPSEKNQQRIKITKQNQTLSFIPLVGILGFFIAIFTN